MKQKRPKRILLFDCEHFYDNFMMPNYKLMKLSSYHKQIGDSVTFVNDKYYLNGTYDICYIAKERYETNYPHHSLMDDKRSYLIGDEFEGFISHYELNPVQSAARPDYLLYNIDPNTRNPLLKANFVSFYSGNTYITKHQGYMNTFKGVKTTIVTDKNIWSEINRSNLVDILEKLSSSEVIIFLYPVSLKVLIDNDHLSRLFINLKIASNKKMVYNNDVGSNLEDAVKVIKFFYKLKNKRPSIRFARPRFDIYSKSPACKEDVLNDFNRCMKIVHFSKGLEVRIVLDKPEERTLGWEWLEYFDYWVSDRYYKKSYIEAILSPTMIRNKLTLEELINNSKNWTGVRINYISHLIQHDECFILKYGTREWGKNSLDLSKMDFDAMRKGRGRWII